MLSLAKEKTSLEKKLSNNEKNNEIVGNDNFSITVIEEADNNVEHIESHKGPCTPPQNNHESLDLAKGPQTPEGIKFKVFLELGNLLCKALKVRYTLMDRYQRCRWVFESGWASSNVVDIICPLVLIGLTELPKAHPVHPLAAALVM